MTATAEPGADLNDGKVKIADIDPALKAAIRRWHDQAHKTRVMLDAAALILTGVIQDEPPDIEGRIPPALEVVEHCVTTLSSLAEEIDGAACGHVLIDAEQSASKSRETHTATADLAVDWDERVVIVHKGHVCVASGELEEQIKQEVARMDEQPAAA
ncbi:MAG: hypothetical protein IID41_15565 [Planctomycetes bacterium]|nr:hypothetical protein [Planctomycetota bacterium]